MLYALAVNDTGTLANKSAVRVALDKALTSALPSGDPASTLHAWGATPEAQAGQSAMMGLLGG